MPRSRIFGFGRVNLIKKVKIEGVWKFCPAVVEHGKKLNDVVRVKGKMETHGEGTYYLEWRAEGKRRREPVRNRACVFEQARLRALELESGVSIRTLQEWLGHGDLASTMIYLKYVRRKDVQQLVDNSEMAVHATHCSTSKTTT